MNRVQELTAVALLAEPVRRRLYEYVRDRHTLVGRDEAAEGAGVSRKLAAFHLDRLADAGLLDVDYQRISGRAGPGAGRPAKLYRVSSNRFQVALPANGNALAASVMATALTRTGESGTEAVRHAAHEVGTRLGTDIHDEHGGEDARRRAVHQTLVDLGFQPEHRPGEIALANCIFAELTDSHRELVCTLNRALIDGLLNGADLTELRTAGGGDGCCVRIVPR
jgi:predicted ArsR family transcriptional regulator